MYKHSCIQTHTHTHTQEPLEEIQGNSRSLVADMDGVKNKVKDSFKRIRDIEEKINQIASKLESSHDAMAM